MAPEPTPQKDVPSADFEGVLRAHLAAHNLRVALFGVLTLLGAAVAWYLLNLAARWLALLFVTTVHGVDARMPANVDRLFWLGAILLLLLAWIDRQLRPDDRPKDHKTVVELIWECVLAVPRLTLSVWGTLSAWQRLSPRDVAAAAALVERLTHESRLPMHSMPLEIPDPNTRFNILFALQLTQIIDIRREDRELWITLNPLRPSELQPPPPAGPS